MCNIIFVLISTFSLTLCIYSEHFIIKYGLKCSIIIRHYISWFLCCYLQKQDTYKISYNRHGLISICFLFNIEKNDYKEVTKSAVWRSHHIENDAKLSAFLEAPKNTMKVTSNKKVRIEGRRSHTWHISCSQSFSSLFRLAGQLLKP